MQLFRKESIPFLIIIILVAAVLVLGGQYYVTRQKLATSENTVKTLQYDQKVLDFTKLFIAKVLKADGDVSFDDRLQLENSVRSINDNTIFDQWQKFINAKTPLEAQIEVKNLLEMLANKISL
jgi:hypothetical protein